MSVVPFRKTPKMESNPNPSPRQTFVKNVICFFLDFWKIKTKCEERGLDSAKVSIEQVPVCKSILITGFSDITHDFIELYFESPRNGGGPVEKVDYVPKSGRAVVVFQDAKGL